MNLRNAATFVACAASIALAGCGTARPTSPPDALDCGLESGHLIVADSFSPVLDLMLDRPLNLSLTDRKPSFNIFALSAGGEFGAYGAAFLGGWRSVGGSATPAARDDIQVVTGVSTGSLIATHAFLGEEGAIEKKFREIDTPDVAKPRSKLSYLWANSLLDASGKDAIIESFITSDVVGRVAASQPGRGLYMGVVDIDSGEFLRIDMVKLARTIAPVERRDACYRAVVGASSAIPIAFSPKFIDGRMMVDGGARRFLFFTDLTPSARRPGVDRNLISLVHGDLRVAPSTTGNEVLQIAGKLSDVVGDQDIKSSIFAQEAIATSCIAKVGMGCSDAAEGIVAAPFATFYAAAAEAAKKCVADGKVCAATTAGGDLFCKPFMNCLADHGKQDGMDFASGAKPWLNAADLNLSSKPPKENLTSAPTAAKEPLYRSRLQ